MQPFPHVTIQLSRRQTRFVLTVRGIAGVSRFSWVSLECSVAGTVDRVDRVTQFTALEVRARLESIVETEEP